MTLEQYKNKLVKYLKEEIEVAEHAKKRAEEDYQTYLEKKTFNFQKALSACADKHGSFVKMESFDRLIWLIENNKIEEE